MPFLGLWTRSGSSVIPLAGVNSLRIPDTGEYATIERTAGNFNLDGGTGAGVSVKAAGVTHLHGDSGETSINNPAGTTKIKINSTGIGVFGGTPVTQQSKQAELNVGVSGLDDTQIFCNTLQERLGLYGWLA